MLGGSLGSIFQVKFIVRKNKGNEKCIFSLFFVQKEILFYKIN